MGYFPMCMDLTGRTILLVGSGPQIEDKVKKLRPFGGELIRLDDLTAADLDIRPAIVVVGDLDADSSARISALCRGRNIPVNVVDDPGNSTFFFPAIITRGPLTVSVSTGGMVPGVAACLSRKISQTLPEDLEEILLRLHDLRRELYESYPKEEARQILKTLTEQALCAE